MDPAAIRVDDVSKRFRVYAERPSSLKERVTHRVRDRYEEFWALKDVSLEVPHGSVYGLVGHNGSGKSSMLRIMAGIHRPTKGRVVTEGRISALLELGAGFHPDLTGRENIYLNAAILGFNRKGTDAILDDVVEFSGLKDFIDAPVKHYSSGMYVRLGFAVAVNVDPQILLIDEVIAVGDEEFQRRCFEHLYKLRNRGVTIVVVTHSLGIVKSMCDRAAWLDHGQLMAEGRASEVVREYLSLVNEAEADRRELEAEAIQEAEADGADQLRAGIDVRHQDQPITIERVEFLDAAGEVTTTAHTNQPLTVRIHFHARHPVEAPLFSFSVESETGTHIATPGMRPSQGVVPEMVGDGHVDYRIDRLSLAAGAYMTSFAVHDTRGMVVFDRLDLKTPLQVLPSAAFVNGLVDLLGHWSEPTLTEESRP